MCYFYSRLVNQKGYRFNMCKNVSVLILCQNYKYECKSILSNESIRVNCIHKCCFSMSLKEIKYLINKCGFCVVFAFFWSTKNQRNVVISISYHTKAGICIWWDYLFRYPRYFCGRYLTGEPILTTLIYRQTADLNQAVKSVESNGRHKYLPNMQSKNNPFEKNRAPMDFHFFRHGSLENRLL